MFAELFVFIFALITLASYLLYKWKFERIISLTQDWPTLPSYPVIGSAHYFLGLASNEILMYLTNLVRQHHKNYCLKFWLGWDPCFFVAHPADIEIIMTSPACVNKATQYECLRDWLREGLLISLDKKWFRRRKLLTPAFHFAILKDYVEVSDKQSKIFVEKLRGYAKSQKSFDIFVDGGLLALDVICETAMGISINAQANADSEYVKAVKSISNVMHRRMFDMLHYFFVLHRFTSLYNESKDALSILHSFSESVIKKRRAELLAAPQKNDSSKLVEDAVGTRRKMSFLDLLLQSTIDGQPLTNIDIREEVDTFMFEGHDTTSSTISFFFYNMAIYPEYQQKCFEEILSVFGTEKSKPAEFDSLNQLPFVELCIKETLRLYPAVPIIGRKTTQDVRLSDGKIIPAGTSTGTMTLYLSRLEEFFPEPNTFRPERFNVEMSAEKINPFAYIPFSAGQRNCIGQKFALLELKSIIVNVLRNFIVDYDGDPNKELHLTGELILRTKFPIMLKVRERVY